MQGRATCTWMIDANTGNCLRSWEEQMTFCCLFWGRQVQTNSETAPITGLLRNFCGPLQWNYSGKHPNIQIGPCCTPQSTMREEQVYIRGSMRNRKIESPDDIRVWVSRRIQASGPAVIQDNYGTSASPPRMKKCLAKRSTARKTTNIITSTAIDAKPGRNGGGAGGLTRIHNTGILLVSIPATRFLQSHPFHYQFEKLPWTVMFPILTSATEKDVDDYTEASPIIVDWNGTTLRRKESFRSEIAFKYDWK